MFPHKYMPLEQASSEDFKESMLGQQDPDAPERHQFTLIRPGRYIYALFMALGLSIVLNVLLFIHPLHLREERHETSFVGLERTLNTTIPHDDRAIDDPMWDSPEFDWNLGWIALDSNFARNKGLPTSMHWPWDDSKSIYVLHGFHSLHCVYVLRDSIMRFHDGRQQLWPFGHVTHCLHVLREDTTCNADDTPRYAGRLHAQENSTMIFSGTGQYHQCRDWDMLRRYAIDHSACYQRPLGQYIPLLDRYKHCPDGSTPWFDKEGLDE